MLTTPSQYLHPDYLQPLPTTLDAKKSPLALLAQTCSSIGKDTAPSKPIIPPIEKDKKDGAKSSSPTGKKSPIDSKLSNNNNTGERVTSPTDVEKRPSSHSAPKEPPPLVPISGDKSSRASSASEKHVDGRRSHTPNVSQPSTSATSSSRISLGSGSGPLEATHSESSATSSSSTSSIVRPSATQPSLSSLRPDLSTPTHGALPPTFGFPGLPFHPLDPSAPNPLYPPLGATSSALSSLAPKGLPAHSIHNTPGLSPYSYARVKTATGATTLVPVCRDPFCTNCQITMQGAHSTSGACAAGCTQCSHEKTLSSASAALNHASLSGLHPMFPLTHGAAAAGLAAGANPLASSLYSHPFGVLPGHTTLPYVCNWVSGSDYCGKRFNTSEELLSHLRTHTSATDSSSVAAAYHALGLTGASPLTCPTLPYPTPGSVSPNSIRHAYPRSLSPTSSILAASRYHPYKSPLSSLPGVPAPTSLPSSMPTTLPPFYSPYALYGPRLGAVP